MHFIYQQYFEILQIIWQENVQSSIGLFSIDVPQNISIYGYFKNIFFHSLNSIGSTFSGTKSLLKNMFLLKINDVHKDENWGYKI